MSLSTGTRVQVVNNYPLITLKNERGTITEIDGSTYVVQLDSYGERYFDANEIEAETPVVAVDFTSWSNYKLLNLLERAIRTGESSDYIMDMQNEIFSRMSN